MSETQTILVIEDDRQIRELVAGTLESEGYAVVEADTAAGGARQAGASRPDLLILDLGLPDRNGINFIRDYRIWSSVPILVLSARSQDISKITALDAGANDYLTKPFSVTELVERVCLLLQSTPENAGQLEPVIRFGDCQIDCTRREVTRAGQPVRLTDIQYRLLMQLVSSPGRVLTHRQLLSGVWGDRVENNQYLRVYVGQLRQKIEINPAQPRHILTETGVGYRFQP